MLTPEQIKDFSQKGFLKLEGAIERNNALNVQQFIWAVMKKKYQISQHDQSTWKYEMVHIREDYNNKILDQCDTTQLNDVIHQLVTPNTPQVQNPVMWGWWPINFSYGRDVAWTVPNEGWHWDGVPFLHKSNSVDVGLLLICLFSDTKHQGGGTLLAAGSHLLALKFLNDESDGIDHTNGVKNCISKFKWLTDLASENNNADDRNKFFLDHKVMHDGVELYIEEITGNAGDIYICHPHLFHNASYNHSGIPRFMCNRSVPLNTEHNYTKNENNSVMEKIGISALAKRT